MYGGGRKGARSIERREMDLIVKRKRAKDWGPPGWPGEWPPTGEEGDRNIPRDVLPTGIVSVSTAASPGTIQSSRLVSPLSLLKMGFVAFVNYSLFRSLSLARVCATN